MDKDLDPLRELDHEELEDAVRAPTVDLPRSSRHDPTRNSRLERSSRHDPTARMDKPHEPDFRQPHGTASPLRNSSVSAPSPLHSLPAIHSMPPPAAAQNRHYAPGPKVRITENIQTRPSINLYAGLVPLMSIFALGIAMAFAALVVTGQQHNDPTAGGEHETVVTINRSPSSIRNSGTTGIELEPPPFIEPLFGQFAVKRCSQRCSERGGAMKDACDRGCNALQIQTFGRRITGERFDPVQDGNEMVNRCLRREITVGTESSGGRWAQQLEAAIRAVNDATTILHTNDYAQVRGLYHRLLDVNRDLRLPPGGTTAENNLTKDLIRGSCLFATSALLRIALGVVESSNDTFSVRSYRQMSQTVDPKAAELQQSIFTQIKSLKIVIPETK